MSNYTLSFACVKCETPLTRRCIRMTKPYLTHTANYRERDVHKELQETIGREYQPEGITTLQNATTQPILESTNKTHQSHQYPSYYPPPT